LSFEEIKKAASRLEEKALPVLPAPAAPRCHRRRLRKELAPLDPQLRQNSSLPALRKQTLDELANGAERVIDVGWRTTSRASSRDSRDSCASRDSTLSRDSRASRATRCSEPARPAWPKGPAAGLSACSLRDWLDFDRPLSRVPKPTLAAMQEPHWLTGEPALRSPCTQVLCDPDVPARALRECLERDCRGQFSSAYLVPGWTPNGSTDRRLWVVDPDGLCFETLVAQAGAAALDCRLDVEPVGGWGPLEAWKDRIAAVNPATAKALPEEKGLVDLVMPRRRKLEQELTRVVFSGYLVRACLDNDAELAKAALAAGADPDWQDPGGLTAVVAAHGTAVAEVLTDHQLSRHGANADFARQALELMREFVAERDPRAFVTEEAGYTEELSAL